MRHMIDICSLSFPHPDSSTEVQVLKEQLRQLSAEMTSLRQALGIHQKHPLPSCPRSHHNHQGKLVSETPQYLLYPSFCPLLPLSAPLA